MTKQEIFDAIMKFNQDHGEDFLDQGFNLNELTFMTWCFGKGYITREKYNLWVTAYSNNELEAIDANYYVYDWQDCGDVPWAVVIGKDFEDEDWKKAMYILAEFISEIDVYIERLKEYVKED
ncbi:hypothetical protein [Bacillus wiedmannii]|uniref:hypothetical protein n=1 Tax=Bacillus wiedmannii TaxID=1890302 RepID=UPI000BFC5A64|nr:hypothetical protein [Bacillus wiedmannii]PHE70582.1 hypothetical protein COF77_25555 [Bacillus wiedmannii]